VNSIAFLLSFLFILTPVSENGTATWYGSNEDNFIGKYHAAYWHNETPQGAPEFVTNNFLGVAAPKSIPFGTKLLIVRKSTCMGHQSPYDNAFIFATVLDRKADYTTPHYYDLWPATARALGFGPTFENDAGCIQVQVFVVGEKKVTE